MPNLENQSPQVRSQALNLNPDVSNVLLDDQLRAVSRELGLRRAKYPKWVQRDQIRLDDAQHEIACLSPVYRTLKNLHQSQQTTPDSPSPPDSSQRSARPVSVGREKG